jgi:hypothetical protein
MRLLNVVTPYTNNSSQRSKQRIEMTLSRLTLSPANMLLEILFSPPAVSCDNNSQRLCLIRRGSDKVLCAAWVPLGNANCDTRRSKSSLQ